jgi:hypothetical protein
MTFYHFTTQPLEELRETGLNPYPLDPTRKDFEFIRNEVKAIKGDTSAIWLWVNPPDDRLILDFLVWKIANNLGMVGTLLSVECPAEHLLSYQLKQKYQGDHFELKHQLYLGNQEKASHNEAFDICLEPIKEFASVAKVEFVITRYSWPTKN